MTNRMSDCGIGCLDSLVDIPCEWYEDAYALLSMEKVDNLYSLLMHEEIRACDGISLFVDSALKEAVLSKDLVKNGLICAAPYKMELVARSLNSSILTFSNRP